MSVASPSPSAVFKPEPTRVIAHVLTSLAVGGGERVALMLAARQVRCGHRVLVVSLEEPPDGPLAAAFLAAGVGIRRVPKRPGFDPSLHLRLAVCFARDAAVVVHSHNPLPLIYAAPAAKLAGATVVHTKHGPHPDAPHRLWMRRAAALATDAFVAVSDATADFARHIHEVAPEKLHVILNATDLERFRPDQERRRAARASWKVSPHTWVIGTVGRMAEVKDHPLLLRAAKPLLEAGAVLVIVGDGPEAERTRWLAAELGIADSCRFLGARDDVAEILPGFDCFALSSRVEGMPLSVVEAMASGLPVVAPSVGGIPAMTEGAALLVPPGDATSLRDALTRLRDDSRHARHLSERGREIAMRRFSDQRMTAEYLALYWPSSCPAGAIPG